MGVGGCGFPVYTQWIKKHLVVIAATTQKRTQGGNKIKPKQHINDV